MALANFFEKTALNASQVLAGYDPVVFKDTLMSHKIVITFDNDSAGSSEASASLDLLVRLLARLYPFLLIEGEPLLTNKLRQLAKDINPLIEDFDPAEATLCVVVGMELYSGSTPVFYIGSDGWIVKLSNNQPVGSCNSGNPFGAGAAACFGAANVFRHVFSKLLPFGKTDSHIDFSLLNFKNGTDGQNGPLPAVVLKNTVMIGAGAIGNAMLWALQDCSEITGQLDVVDDEPVQLTNLQRYVLAIQHDIDKQKVYMAGDYFNESRLKMIPHPVNLQEYVQHNDEAIHQMCICIDNRNDRILAQGILPKNIFNAWTQPENLGISRHTKFGQEACLACLYYPLAPQKSLSQEIADSLHIPHLERKVREYVANNKIVDKGFVIEIAAANNINPEELFPFVGKSMLVFHSEVVCGGVLLALGGNATESNPNGAGVSVPAAFESALAGILLAAELVRDSMPVSIKTNSLQVNLLRPFSPYWEVSADMHPDCICHDAVYRAVYKRKWRNEAKELVGQTVNAQLM